MFLANALDALPGVRALHEGHDPHLRTPQLPLVNFQNRQAWSDRGIARSVVRERRGDEVLAMAANGGSVLVDVAFYNAPLLPQLAEQYPDAKLLTIVRRCEGFVRSATIMEGEDLQPAGWPDPQKDLTSREQFIQLGRHRPADGTADADAWQSWTGIQRNIWLWHSVNSHLMSCQNSLANTTMLRYEDLAKAPQHFWSSCLGALELDIEDNRARSVERSSRPLNKRPDYQVGPLETWSLEERDLYERLAQPLEVELYES